MNTTMIVDERLCPLCQSQNACMANTSCWCNNQKVPQELRDLLPEEQKNKACICNKCITAFNEANEL